MTNKTVREILRQERRRTAARLDHFEKTKAYGGAGWREEQEIDDLRLKLANIDTALAEPDKKEEKMPAMEVHELIRKFDAAMHELNEIEQILGEALDYPRYVDDPKNFPEATERDGVCVGEMTPATLAEQAAKRIKEMRETVATKQVRESVRITPVLKLEEDTIYYEPVTGEIGRWYPALVEVDFTSDPNGRVILTIPGQESVMVNLTVDEWWAISKYIDQRIIGEETGGMNG